MAHEHFSSSSTTNHPEPRSLSLAFRYAYRAACLKCPECGKTPIFPAAKSVRRLSDWFTPLDGCPRCGYPYEREIGYFLMAIWAVGYGLGSVVGIGLYLFFEYVEHFSLTKNLLITLPIVFLVNLLFARHSKAFWLALDHFFDPHVRPPREEDNNDDDDDGGGKGPHDTPHSPNGDHYNSDFEKNSKAIENEQLIESRMADHSNMY